MKSKQQERIFLGLVFGAIALAVLGMGGIAIASIWGGVPSPNGIAASGTTTALSTTASQNPATLADSSAQPSAVTGLPQESATLPATPAESPQPQLTAAAVGAPTETPQGSATELGFNRPTSTGVVVTDTPAPNATPTFDDNPLLILTAPTPPAPTATPQPLTGLGNSVELSVAQVQRIAVDGGFVLVADIGNTTDGSVKNVTLIFTDASGARVGSGLPLNLNLPPNDARPGLTPKLAANDPIITGWGTLQARAAGTPATTGAVAAVEVSPPQITQSDTDYAYQATVTNTTGARVSILYQNLAFFANDGTLLLVINLGPHAPVDAGASYTLTGTIPLGQPSAEGHALAEYSDVLGNVIAEVWP
jgi:hypothetical protein